MPGLQNALAPLAHAFAIQTKTHSKFKRNSKRTFEIQTKQSVLAEDFKAHEIEVGVARADWGTGAAADERSFRTLTTEEVDAFLVAIAERD